MYLPRIQRAWRQRLARRNISHILSRDVVTLLQTDFPDLCIDYSLPLVPDSDYAESSAYMVFSGIRSGSFSTGSGNANQVVKNIIPNNNNMSLFGDLKISNSTGFSFTSLSRKHNNPFTSSKNTPDTHVYPTTDFDTPVPAKRKIIETSYIFEKELREDFSNPYCLDSDSEEDNTTSQGSEEKSKVTHLFSPVNPRDLLE